MALFSSLSDDFNDGALGAIWSTSYGAVSESGGRARILSDTGYPAIKTDAAHTLTGSHVLVEAFPAPVGDATTAVSSQMSIDSPTAGTRLIIMVVLNLGEIRFHNQTGYWDDSGVTIPYDPVAHRWWRIAESAGTVTMSTSPDGTTWTDRRTLTTPAWATATDLPLVFMTHRDDGAATNYFEFDNFNLTPATDTPPAAPSGVLATPSDTSASLTWTPGNGATSYEVQYRPVESVDPWTTIVLDAPAGTVWEQTSGPAAALTNSDGTATLTPPVSMQSQDITLSHVTGETHIEVRRAPTGLVGAGGVVTPVRMARPPAAPPAPRTPLPARVVGGYWEGWGTVSLGSVPAGYNTVFLCFATAAAPGTATVTFTQSVQTDTSLRADIQALQAEGRPVLLSVGGWEDGAVQMLTAEQAQNMVESVAAIVEDYGLDGVDWDLEHLDQITAATLYYASQMLRERFGDTLLITTAFSPSATLYKNFLRLMGTSIDMAGMMFYDYAATHAEIVSKTTELITAYGMDPSQVSVGFMSGTNANTMTTAELSAAYDEIEATYPGIRGGYNWAISADAGIGYTFLNEIAPAITNTAPPEPAVMELAIHPSVRSAASKTHSSSSGTVGAETVPVPVGVQAGDLLVLYGVMDSGTLSNLNPPSGFTVLGEMAASASNNVRHHVAYKVAGASEPATYTWAAFDAGADGASMMVAVKDWDGSTANLRYAQAETTKTALAIPAVTPAKDGLVLFSGAHDSSGAGTWKYDWVAPQGAKLAGKSTNAGAWSGLGAASEIVTDTTTISGRSWANSTLTATPAPVITTALTIGGTAATTTQLLGSKSGGSGGSTTDQPSQTFQDGAGRSSTYHLYAGGLDWTKDVGLLIYTDGSGDYGLTTGLSSQYLMAGTYGMIATAKKHNMVLLAPVPPGDGCTDGDGTCWYMNSLDGTTAAQKLQWSKELIEWVFTRYDLSRTRVAFGGYSSGAQWTTQFWGPGHAHEQVVDGVAVAISYGGAPAVTNNNTADYKANVTYVWDVGELDTAWSQPTWEDSVKEGHDYYAANGYTTHLTIVGGGTHDRYIPSPEIGEFGRIMDRYITDHVRPT